MSQFSTILLTGATGFVGRQILQCIKKSGIELILVLRPGQEKLIDESIPVKKIFFTSDMFFEDASWWEDIMCDVDLCIHSAWFVKHDEYIDSPLNFKCVAGTSQMAIAASSAGLKKFVGVGSCSEVELIDVQFCNAPSNPSAHSIYTSSKVCTQLLLENFFSKSNTKFLWCRLPYLYGDGEHSERLHPYLRRCFEHGKDPILHNPSLLKDYLDVSVAASKLFDASISSECGIKNISSGMKKSIHEIAVQVKNDCSRHHFHEKI